jgi:hypothetical protein
MSGMERGAMIEDTVRWWLYRCWDTSRPWLIFVMLNPSTADANDDDPTIRRCIRFAKDNDYGSLGVVNLCPYRATNPNGLLQWVKSTPHEYRHEVFQINLEHIRTWCRGRAVILAWGAQASKISEEAEEVKAVVMSCANKVYCLGRTEHGQFKHPLYLPADTKWEQLHV